MSSLPPLPLINVDALETREVWAALTEAHRYLAELKGLCESLPNQGILLDTSLCGFSRVKGFVYRGSCDLQGVKGFSEESITTEARMSITLWR